MVEIFWRVGNVTRCCGSVLGLKEAGNKYPWHKIRQSQTESSMEEHLLSANKMQTSGAIRRKVNQLFGKHFFY